MLILIGNLYYLRLQGYVCPNEPFADTHRSKTSSELTIAYYIFCGEYISLELENDK